MSLPWKDTSRIAGGPSITLHFPAPGVSLSSTVPTGLGDALLTRLGVKYKQGVGGWLAFQILTLLSLPGKTGGILHL